MTRKATKLLLLIDIGELGRRGEVVNVKPGYARNYLIPQGVAVIADPRTLNLQRRLQDERQKQAVVDKEESEKFAQHLSGLQVVAVVKVDPEGHMYGSVHTADILKYLEDQHQVILDKKNLSLKQPIKLTGLHQIAVKLKEGVTSSFYLKVLSEEEHRFAQETEPSSETQTEGERGE
jgi:large subunit ribosomal protein L9